jgi:hypothetical protein
MAQRFLGVIFDNTYDIAVALLYAAFVLVRPVALLSQYLAVDGWLASQVALSP